MRPPIEEQALKADDCKGIATMESPVDIDIDIDRVAYGFMASQALFSGLELQIFDIIDGNGAPMTVELLKESCGVSAPRLQTLVTALTAIHALHKGPDGYSLSTNTARYLVSSSKHFYGDYLRLQIGQQFYKHMTALPDIMQTGKAPNYEALFADTREADTYTRAQHNGSLATAGQLCRRVDFTGMRSLLDIGGGSGAFAITICRKHPELHAKILEFPEVCKTGEKFVAAEPRQVAQRITYIRGSCLDEWPAELGNGHDVVLMSYVSESVPAEAVPMIYKLAFERLRPGGMLIVHSFMVEDTLDGPELGALWSLQHVAVNADGLGLAPAIVTRMMQDAGFEAFKANDMIKGMTKVVIGKKPTV
jgi:predicted O-methyltransferase YrrM